MTAATTQRIRAAIAKVCSASSSNSCDKPISINSTWPRPRQPAHEAGHRKQDRCQLVTHRGNTHRTLCRRSRYDVCIFCRRRYLPQEYNFVNECSACVLAVIITYMRSCKSSAKEGLSERSGEMDGWMEERRAMRVRWKRRKELWPEVSASGWKAEASQRLEAHSQLAR